MRISAGTEAATFTITLFGQFSARVHGKPLSGLRSRKGEWLLALLALNHRREVDRDWLAGTLWPESLGRQARANLRLCLTDLRQALGDQAYRLQSPTSRTLCLDLTAAEVDIVAFDQAIADQTPRALEEAVRLYSGPLLAGWAEEWVLLERQTREQAYLQALEALAAHALGRKDFATAVAHLRRVVTLEPLREEAHRALMRALAAAGDHAAATQVYRALRQYLYAEMNAEPAPETAALVRRLRSQARQQMQNATAAPTDATARDTVALAPPPSHLPRPLTPLVGRQEAIHSIADLLISTRLVTLTGSGGVGKTRLAIAVAEEVREAFPDGVWFVDLAALSDVALVAQTVAETLQMREEPGLPLRQTLCESLRHKTLLLLLDNCEHLLSACAALVSDLLESCPRLHMLITSRQALGLPMETSWRVPSLSLPPGKRWLEESPSLFDRLQEYEAIQLFLQRTAVRQPDFALTMHNAASILEVCQRLDGIPLAIELAAARMNVITVEQIKARLHDRFQLLTAGSHQAPPRHQTLQASIDDSVDLLSEAERVLLGRLAVFGGSWTLEATEAVCAGPGVAQQAVLDLLAGLVNKSLVLVEMRHGTARYRLLETLRQYCLEKNHDGGELQGLRRRHRDWYLQQVIEAGRERYLPSMKVWLERLEDEVDNLRQALTWSGTEADGAEALLEMGVILSSYWYVRGHLSEGRHWLESALSRTEGFCSPLRARAICSAANMATEQADCIQAVALGRQSLEMFQRLGSQRGMAEALHCLGYAEHERGNYQAACVHYEAALPLWQAVGSRAGYALSLNNLGMALCFLGDYERAIPPCEESLLLFREDANHWGISVALNVLGVIASRQGEYARAQALHQEALALQKEMGSQLGIALSLHNLGWIALRQRDVEQALSFFRQALHLHREAGDRLGLADVFDDLGVAALEQEDFGRAARLLGAGAILRQGIHVPVRLADQPSYEHHLAVIRSALGEEAFAGAWAAGQAMPLEKALAYALEAQD
jgi:predicted ATPase/DNA-binding SARP family transcriptional activator